MKLVDYWDVDDDIDAAAAVVADGGDDKLVRC